MTPVMTTKSTLEEDLLLMRDSRKVAPTRHPLLPKLLSGELSPTQNGCTLKETC
jgi:hypothetical protein